ncbi:MAG: SHD1 domain-containing protein [Thermoguttaceae bacterium]
MKNCFAGWKADVSRHGGSRGRWWRLLATVGLIAVTLGAGGCSGGQGNSDGPTVPEAYPGVVSPVDVGPQPKPASGVDGRTIMSQPTQKKVEYMVGKYGMDSVVAVVVEGSTREMDNQVRQALHAAAESNAESFTFAHGGRTIGYVAPVKDLDRFAANFDIGEIQVDAKKRVVLAKVVADKLAKAATPKQPDMGRSPGFGTHGSAPPPASQPSAPALDAAPADEIRTWTDITGQFKVEGALVELRQGQVSLRSAEGGLVAVPLERLSAADQDYVKKAAAEKGKSP